MSKGWSFSSGDWWIHCDVCGKKIKATDSRERWDGFRVCGEDWEPRHSLDFIRAKSDKIYVDFVRKQADDTFTTVDYICTVDGITAIAGLATVGCSVVGNT